MKEQLISSKTPTIYHVHTRYPSEKEFLYAPTQSLLQKWLRENKEVIISIIPIKISDSKSKGFRFSWFTNINELTDQSLLGYLTYEEALEQAIFQSLKHIKSL